MHKHHAIDYVEFTVRDLVEAKQFYAAAFGWAFNDYGPEYAGIRGSDGEVGGLHQTGPLRRGGPLVILYSDDLEASLAERRYLQRSIGKIGLLALKPLQVTSHRDDWHRHLLQQRASRVVEIK